MQPATIKKGKIELKHTPQWNIVGEEYHYVVGNRSVAKIVSLKETLFPRWKWLTVMDKAYRDSCWHAVDCGDLQSG